MNGTSANDGRVEVQYNSSTEWGTLCDDNYGTADAAVICRQLGFSKYDISYNVHFYLLHDNYMSLVLRTFFGVSDQARQTPGCANTYDDYTYLKGAL